VTVLTAQKRATYLAAAAAMGAVFVSGEIPVPFVVVAIAAFVASWFWGERLVGRAGFIWNTIVVAAILYLGASMMLGVMDIVLAASIFAVTLLINRLYNLRSPREYAQLHLMMLLCLSGGAILSADLMFGVSFLVFAIAAIWSLTLALLRAEIEEEARSNQIADHGLTTLTSHRVVSTRLFVFQGGQAMAAIAAAAVIFVLFPRLQFNKWGRAGAAGGSTAGFSGQVDLSGKGMIKDDPRVAFRVFFSDGSHITGGTELGYYWRGATMDEYDGRAWANTGDPARQRPVQPPWGLISLGDRSGVDHPAKETREPEEISIELVPDVAQNVLFATGAVQGLRFQHKGVIPAGTKPLTLWTTEDGDLSYKPQQQAEFRYTIRTILDDDIPRLRGQGRDYDAIDTDRYLQLPDKLNTRITTLGKRLGAGKDPAEAVTAVTRYLSAYTYSLDVRAGGADPLSSFLFEVRAGHCEYFATATAVLLRAAGVPTRLVTGFYGGRFISNGNYYALRQGDAHAWAEVYFPKTGWTTVDATPVGDREAHVGSLYSAVALWVDGTRTQWRNLVVEYDLLTQIRGVRALISAANDLSARLAGRGKTTRLQRAGSMFAAGTLLLVLVVLARMLFRRQWRWTRRGAPQLKLTDAQRRALQLDRELFRRLARRGIARRPSQTARELAAEVRERKLPMSDVVDRVLDRTLASRYGQRPLTAADVRELRDQLRRV
jgi:transglutaminase-like putative cysteine protease